MTTQGAVAALIKITRAVERGSVAVKEVQLDRLAGCDYLTVELHPDDPKSAAWFLWAYAPGMVLQEQDRTIENGYARGVYYDALDYVRPIGNHSSLMVTLWRDHEHWRYEPIEKVLRHGIQVWRCKDYKVRLTTTQARALNLVAPR